MVSAVVGKEVARKELVGVITGVGGTVMLGKGVALISKMGVSVMGVAVTVAAVMGVAVMGVALMAFEAAVVVISRVEVRVGVKLVGITEGWEEEMEVLLEVPMTVIVEVGVMLMLVDEVVIVGASVAMSNIIIITHQSPQDPIL